MFKHNFRLIAEIIFHQELRNCDGFIIPKKIFAMHRPAEVINLYI